MQHSFFSLISRFYHYTVQRLATKRLSEGEAKFLLWFWLNVTQNQVFPKSLGKPGADFKSRSCFHFFRSSGVCWLETTSIKLRVCSTWTLNFIALHQERIHRWRQEEFHFEKQADRKSSLKQKCSHASHSNIAAIDSLPKNTHISGKVKCTWW